MSKMKFDFRTPKFVLEYAGLFLFMSMLNMIPCEKASELSGRIAQRVGPRMGSHRRAMKHLKMCLPGKTDEEYEEILLNMWDHLGRILAELPDLEYFIDDLELAGVTHIQKAISDHGQAIVFSGHIGNWELMAPTLLRHNMPMDLVYRAPNNPFVEKMLARYRSLNGRLRLLPKSQAGTRQLVEAVKNGRSIGILIDQKYNEGIDVPFFGHPAMTSPAFVQLGQKYNCPLVPFRVERLEGSHFRLTFYPALQIFDETGAPRPVKDVIGDAHRLLESWITERPEQWLWLHKRWKEDEV